ncbi:hypothetical protein GOV11_00040 [Candidatus Woesearchaeota archaeon]|nr:hypothetical protein [Candidatus Woesearchaeota archaeon]
MVELEKIIYLSWEESERGWGVRPDGCSLHLTAEDAEKYVDNYRDGMPREAPREYMCPSGNPIVAGAAPDLYKRVKESKYGIRLFSGEEGRAMNSKELELGPERTGWMPI